MVGKHESEEVVTHGLLQELRKLAEDIGHAHMDYAHEFQRLLQSLANPNLPDIAKEMQYSVKSYERGTRKEKRTIAVSSNPTVARAAYECACKIFPEDRWIVTWGGMVMDESERLPVGE